MNIGITMTILLNSSLKKKEVENMNINQIIETYLKSLSEEDITKKPTVLSEEESTNIIIKAIEEKKEKIIYPLSMKILISIITKLPKRVLTYILMKQANWDRK